MDFNVLSTTQVHLRTDFKIVIITDNFCIALFSGVPKLTHKIRDRENFGDDDDDDDGGGGGGGGSKRNRGRRRRMYLRLQSFEQETYP